MKPLENLDRYNIILGSGSPRRKELLSELGLKFNVRPLVGVEETYPCGLAREDVAEYLSQYKAKAYFSTLSDDELLITADTIVLCGNEVMGKPHDYNDAYNMLSTLSGKSHKVITGVTITTKNKTKSFSVCTDVEFATLDNDEIDYYITKYRPFDKAGAYGIQEWIGYIGVKGISGSFYNVMGLPMHRLYTELKSF